MLVTKASRGDNGVLLIGWESSEIRGSHRSQYFQLLSKNRYFWAEGITSPTRPDAVKTYFIDWLSSRVRFREFNEIPTEPGFCFDHGFIADSSEVDEQIMASISFPAPFDYVTVSINAATTGKPSEPLLDRAPAAILTVGNVLAGMSTLRAKNRTVNAMPGQEYLIRANSEGKRSYEFTWQYPGKTNSLSDQDISIDLSTSNRRDDRGQVVDAPFANDEEALAFWDGLLAGFRLRPGAAGGQK